ncbi:SIMPL domain-containing protein [Rhodococcus olei]|uniref:SIMPL domain-containing protein n=1 Tax=Rhodococcus olei TaxID=2161675 RepID=UPI0031E7E40C
MTPRSVTITVTGHAERDFVPNRCTVVLRVHADGAAREEAADPVAAAVTTVTDLVTALREHAHTPVKRWSLDQVRHGRHRPFNRDGKKRPWVYSSSASITVTFTDFRAVGPFVNRVAEVDAVTVAHLRWWITRKAQARRLATVRDLAVRDALAKAKGYTKSLGYSTFHAVAIADPGMLGLPPSPGAPMGGPMLRAAALPMDAAPDEGPELVLEPDRITIAADVEARFEAS